MLESIGQNHVTARFSFIGRNPFISFKSLNDEITISDYTGKTNTYKGKPMEELENLLKSTKHRNLKIYRHLTAVR